MNIARKLIAGSFVAIALGGVAHAADYSYSPNSYATTPFGASPFEGVYAGAYAGAGFDPNAKFALGGMAGVNFEVVDGVIVGAEVQGGAQTDGTTTTFEGLMLGRGGALVAPDLLAYGALGGGLANGTTSWAAGGGAEFMATDSLGVRGELLGTGPWGGGLANTRATAGVVLHVR